MRGLAVWVRVACMSADARCVRRSQSIYIRGITIKYLCVPQETMALVKDETSQRDDVGKGRGRGRGRGRGQDDKRGGGSGAGGEKRGRGRG